MTALRQRMLEDLRIRNCAPSTVECYIRAVGGLSLDGKRWVSCRKSSFLLPVLVLSSRFRNLFLTYLRKAFEEGKLQFRGEMAALNRPPAFEALCRRAAKVKWVVFAKAPFGGPEQVLKYLARYTHRVAISNSRILSMEDGKVTFLWKDYADGNQTRVMTLAATEFIRRFLLHILPAGFVRIRQYGFLANRARKEKLALCRTLLSAMCRASPDALHDDKPKQKRCPVCTTGHMMLIQVFRSDRPDSS